MRFSNKLGTIIYLIEYWTHHLPVDVVLKDRRRVSAVRGTVEHHLLIQLVALQQATQLGPRVGQVWGKEMVNIFVLGVLFFF